MFEIQASQTDLKSISSAFEEMHQRIVRFRNYEMPNVLFMWQQYDMHRKVPFVIQKRKKVATVIWPHSKKEMKRSHLAAVRAHRRHIAAPRHWSTRPILREVLYDQLVTEMNERLREQIHW